MKTAHSLADVARLTCPKCRKPFDATVWLIVDVAERPDLAAHAAQGTIHKVPCPHCRTVGQIGAPLLVYLPDPPLPQMHMLLLPSQPDDEARTQEESAWLMGVLRERLGNQWQKEWATASIPLATPELVAAALSDDPIRALREFFISLAEALRQEFLASRDLESLREAIHAFEGVEALLPPDSLDLAPLLNDRGRCRWMAYDTAHNPADLYAAIADYENALALAPSSGPGLATLLINYGITLEDRFKLSRHPADLNSAIDAYERAVAATPPHTLQLPRNLNSLAIALHQRFLETKNLADLQRSVRLTRQTIAESQPKSRDLPVLRFNLALRLGDLEEATGDPVVRDQAIEAHQLALTTTRQDAANRLQLLDSLVQILTRQLNADDTPEHLDALIEVQRQLVQACDPADPNYPGHLAALGSRLAQRYAATKSRADLDEAIATSQEAVAKAPGDSPGLYGALVNLGSMAAQRHLVTGDSADLLLATQSFGRVPLLAPQAPPQLADQLFGLGMRWLERQAETGSADDLDAAIGCFRQAAGVPGGDAEAQAEHLLILGSAVGQRFGLLKQRPDRDEAITLFERASELAPTGSQLRGRTLDQLARSLSIRYEKEANQEDLEVSIQACREALDLLPDSPKTPAILSNLGTALRQRHLAQGSTQDLEEAVSHLLRAVALDGADAPDRPPHLNNLGNALYDMYARTGGLIYLDQAIGYWQAAVDLAPPASALEAARLNNLGDGLRTRFMHTHDLRDLERAIGFLRQAVKAAPSGSQEQARHLTNLGTALVTRYGETADPHDIEEALGVLTEAYDLGQAYPAEHDAAAFLLGTAEYNAYMNDRSPGRLNAAVTHLQQGNALASSRSPNLPNILYYLGRALESRYRLTGEPADLQAAAATYRDACQKGALAQPAMVLAAGRSWGDWAVERRAWGEAAEGYGAGLQAVDEILSAQLLRREKENWIKDAGRIALDAAHALVRCGDLTGAVVALERGRARLLAETLEQTRRDLDTLPALGHADLLERYQQAAQRMDTLRRTAEKPAGASDRTKGATDDAFARAMNEAREDLEATIAAIRQVPGYEDFFLPPSFEKIRQTATADTPLVYLVITSVGGLALVVTGDKPGFSEKLGLSPVSAIWLDGITEAKLRERIYGPVNAPALGGYLGAYDRWRQRPSHPDARRAWFAALNETTQWLWDVVMGPVLEHLTPPPAPSPLPSVTRLGRGEGAAVAAGGGVRLIPIGLLSLLPLHAAWTADPNAPAGRRYALDALTIGYTPSARGLAAARASAARVGPDSILAVDNPDGSLDFSAPEIDAVLSYFPADLSVALRRSNATRQAVLEHLPGSAVLHFSTHGWAGWRQPLESGMLLAGKENLILADLFDLRLDRARLAVLSACETGVPGTELPDEVVGLPVGFMQAGAAGVVASLWSVNDRSTAMLMERFYRLWREDGLNPALALREAQRWLRDTTNWEKAEYFKRDVPVLSATRMPETVAIDLYVDRMQTEPDARPFTHPFWWAAFYLTGV